MKTIFKKNAKFVCLCIILCLLYSFIYQEKENDLKLRNIEMLSRGENETKRKCVEGGGFCVDNDGIAYGGMRVNKNK